MRLSLRLVALVAVSLTFAACSGSGPRGPVVDPGAPPDDGRPDYELFDPAGYDAEPAAPTTVVHDVPARVMEGRVEVPTQGGGAPSSEPAPPTPRQVDGYRVQIFNTASRDAAERVRGDALDWWSAIRSEPGAPRQMDVVIAYQQPYYRVRMGAFGSREDADRALTLVRGRFPDAFLVADIVTVTE